MDGTMDDASSLRTPESSSSDSTVRRDPHHPNSRRTRRIRPVKKKEDDMIKLARELRARHHQRQELMPLCEIGRRWTWATWNASKLLEIMPWPQPPLQKDIENAKTLFLLALQIEISREEAVGYFTKDGTILTIDTMRDHMEVLIHFYNRLLNADLTYSKVKLSTQILRRDATRVFRALSRESNFVGWDVVVGTYEWIDQYLSAKYVLRTSNDDELDMAIPEIIVEEHLDIIFPMYQCPQEFDRIPREGVIVG